MANKDQFRRDFIANIHVHTQNIKLLDNGLRFPFTPKIFSVSMSSECCMSYNPPFSIMPLQFKDFAYTATKLQYLDIQLSGYLV